MELQKWIIIGGIIFLLDVVCITWTQDYGIIKVYNLKEKKKYHYLGALWIRKKKGGFYLKIPKKMLEKSFTTQYKLKSVSSFHKGKSGESLQVIFAEDYQTTTTLKEEMLIKNYIATSWQL